MWCTSYEDTCKRKSFCVVIFVYLAPRMNALRRISTPLWSSFLSAESAYEPYEPLLNTWPVDWATAHWTNFWRIGLPFAAGTKLARIIELPNKRKVNMWRPERISLWLLRGCNLWSPDWPHRKHQAEQWLSHTCGQVNLYRQTSETTWTAQLYLPRKAKWMEAAFKKVACSHDSVSTTLLLTHPDLLTIGAAATVQKQRRAVEHLAWLQGMLTRRGHTCWYQDECLRHEGFQQHLTLTASLLPEKTHIKLA